MTRPRPTRRTVLGVVTLGALVACTPYPRDPGRTLDLVRERGELRIGVSPADPWTLVGEGALEGAAPIGEADGLPLAGIEVGLARAFAEHLAVEPIWHVDGEAGLVEKVELGQLDLVIAGLTHDTQWSKKVSVTRDYTEAADASGRKRKHVMAVPLGENAFLSELERFLDSRPDSEKGAN